MKQGLEFGLAGNSTFRLVSTPRPLLRFFQPDRIGLGKWR
jgi:hypothetical protein